jgi:signal transduction histidine kinase
LQACEAELRAANVDSPFADVASFFDEIMHALRRDFGVADSQSPLPESSTAAAKIAKERHGAGVSLTQLLPIFGAISQAIGKVGERYELTILAEEYKRLNRCIDTGVATAIEGYWRRHREGEQRLITERFGFLAHELRNALGNASVAFRLLRDGGLAVSGPTADVLGRSLGRMEALVAQSLTSAQLEVGVPPDLHPTALKQVLQDLEASIVPGRGSTIRLHFDTNHELLVLANSTLLTSALSNLVHNALKFSPPAATVHLHLRRSGEFAIIDVEDQCGGLGELDPSRLFLPYVKREQGNPQGTGLGLSIAKRAVDSMHGTVAVVDLPGQGCVFSVCFPAVVA